jgi:hypothetical protein
MFGSVACLNGRCDARQSVMTERWQKGSLRLGWTYAVRVRMIELRR